MHPHNQNKFTPLVERIVKFIEKPISILTLDDDGNCNCIFYCFIFIFTYIYFKNHFPSMFEEKFKILLLRWGNDQKLI